MPFKKYFKEQGYIRYSLFVEINLHTGESPLENQIKRTVRMER